ncbi:DUF1580 domain-containing protein [bacterium]|nr:DUF1580 domain-containing protein [bacterium]
MAIDIDSEELIHFPEARSEFPKRPCMQTMHRWRLSGIRGVKLESILVGGLRYTSREAVRRFIERLNADDTSPRETEAAVKSRRQRQAEAAMAALATR